MLFIVMNSSSLVFIYTFTSSLQIIQNPPFHISALTSTYPLDDSSLQMRHNRTKQLCCFLGLFYPGSIFGPTTWTFYSYTLNMASVLPPLADFSKLLIISVEFGFVGFFCNSIEANAFNANNCLKIKIIYITHRLLLAGNISLPLQHLEAIQEPRYSKSHQYYTLHPHSP